MERGLSPASAQAAGAPYASHHRFRRILLGLFAIEWIALGVAPHDRTTWVLENVLVVALMAAALASSRHFVFSRLSYALIFVFLCIHEIGAHYTYSDVPYDDWSRAFLGFSPQQALGLERNAFDRLVHFLYGLLLAYPLREIFVRIVATRGLWGYASPLGMVLATSGLYELCEWAAAAVFGGDVGVAYVGAQGDVWDSQKDMTAAILGAVLAMGTALAVNLALQRDFAVEWHESLRVKDPEPLGEDAISRMLHENGPGDGRAPPSRR